MGSILSGWSNIPSSYQFRHLKFTRADTDCQFGFVITKHWKNSVPPLQTTLKTPTFASDAIWQIGFTAKLPSLENIGPSLNVGIDSLNWAEYGILTSILRQATMYLPVIGMFQICSVRNLSTNWKTESCLLLYREGMTIWITNQGMNRLCSMIGLSK